MSFILLWFYIWGMFPMYMMVREDNPSYTKLDLILALLSWPISLPGAVIAGTYRWFRETFKAP